jgi:hypothetical protein
MLLYKVFFINKEIVFVGVQFPEFAIKDVEVLVAEILSYFIDVGLFANLIEDCH